MFRSIYVSYVRFVMLTHLFVKQMETFASVAEDATVKAASPDTLHDTLHDGAGDSNPDFFKRSNAEYYSAA